MRLIGIAARGSRAGPSLHRIVPLQHPKGTLEARNPRESFRGYTHHASEAAFEVPPGQADPPREVVHHDESPMPMDVVDGESHAAIDTGWIAVPGQAALHGRRSLGE